MKILVVTECSEIKTGYGVVGKNLIQTLINNGHDVVELSLFIDPDDEKLRKIKWPYIVNNPSSSDPEIDQFNSNRFNIEGMWSFDRSLLEVKPDILIDIRDPYAYQYELYSPYRDFFNWLVFAPVDGKDQPLQWRETLRKSDGVFTITEWGQELIESYGIPVVGTVYHSASENFFPMDNVEEIKDNIGLKGKTVIGTVMRNQPRKLFPTLFAGFREYLDKTKDDAILYCHTRHPDGGWDIPSLLMEHNITSKVMFTYFCSNCKRTHSSIYKDILCQCPFCKKHTCKLGSIFDDISEETMNIIYNMFDVYIQLSCREGFGIPQIEAASADVNIITVDYAGMSDVGRKLGSILIKPDVIAYTHSMQMYEASFNSSTISSVIEESLYSKSESLKNCRKNFGSWEENFSPLIEYIKTLKPKKDWYSEGEILRIPEYQDIRCSNSEYVEYLYSNVLGKPEWFGDYSSTRMIRDLGYTATFGGSNGIYFLESSNCVSTIHFDRKAAYQICRNYREFLNLWEKRRVEYDKSTIYS